MRRLPFGVSINTKIKNVERWVKLRDKSLGDTLRYERKMRKAMSVFNVDELEEYAEDNWYRLYNLVSDETLARHKEENKQ